MLLSSKELIKKLNEAGAVLSVLNQTKLTKLMKKRLLTHPTFRQFMKITFLQSMLIWIGLSLSYAHSSVSQELLDRTISLNLENVEVKRALVQIERLAKVKFVYSPNAIGAYRKISVVAVN